MEKKKRGRPMSSADAAAFCLVMPVNSISIPKWLVNKMTCTPFCSVRVELVSPVLLYREDIDTLQGLVRRLRKAGGFANPSCGIHIHLDGSNHTPRSIRNFVNIIASHNDLFYKALQIKPERMRYCKKMDAWLVQRMNQAKPTT